MQFTERGQEVLSRAAESARELKHDHIGTGHILLGLLGEEEGLAALVFEHLNITAELVRQEVLEIVGPGVEAGPDELPFTSEASKVLELAERQARSFGHRDIGAEHILVALMCDPGPAERILAKFDADPEMIRNEVIRLLSVPGERSVGSGNAAGDRPVVRGAVSASMVSPTTHARELLAAAVGEAAHDGRSEFDAADLLLAVSRDEDAGQLLADLGVDEAEMRKEIARRRAEHKPPEDPKSTWPLR